MFKSLKKEILVFTLGLTIVTIIVTTTTSVFSTKTAGRDAETVMSEILREQSKESLIQITEMAANHQDILFERIRDNTDNIALYTKNFYENPSVFSNNGYWEFNTRVFRKNGRYLNRTSDISTVHIPSFVALDTDEKMNMQFTANLDFIVPGILQTNPDTGAIYAIDKKGVTRYFPNIVLGNLAPPDYDPREDIYYKPATPEENPDKKVIWSALYDDVAGRGLMITATAPIYTKNGFEGIVGTDVLLTRIIKSITSYSPIEGSYAFLIDKQGGTVAFPDRAYKDILERDRKDEETRTDLHNSSQEFSVILKAMTDGLTGFGSIRGGDKELFIAYAPLKQTGFSMAVVVEGAVMLKAVSALHTGISNSIQNTITARILPTSLILIIFTSFIGFLLVAQIVKPVRKLTLGVREIGKGNLDYQIKLDSKNEIGELASSFNQMGQALNKSRKELSAYSEGLEKKVKERTLELTKANEHLRELDKEKSEFVSIASHQLRTPLTAISGYASMLLEGSYGKLSEKTQEAVSRIFQSSGRLVLIIEDFLDITKIEQGRMTYQFVTVDMKELLQGVVEEMHTLAREKNLEIILKIDDRGSFNATADFGKIRQVISNLVDNAIKYSTAGKIDIVLSRDSLCGKIKVSIHDTGIGISSKTMEKLFQKFSRAEGVKKIYTEGSGLGLYVAQEIMKAHHGRIWADSEGEGKGSTFRVELMGED